MVKRCILSIFDVKSVDVNLKEEIVKNMKANFIVWKIMQNYCETPAHLATNQFKADLLQHLEEYGIRSTLFVLSVMNHLLEAIFMKPKEDPIVNYTLPNNLEPHVPSAISLW
mmetsp:Transcript_3241/g.4473  ORF Transcript_3241/g.4473 Transcript_3241/m.4473 type:complete len:112 (-) Transcript_3241:323-658(-)